MSNNQKFNGNGHNHDPDGKPDHNIIEFSKPAKTPGEPLINLPPATKFLALLFLGLHAALALLLDEQQRYSVFFTYGFVPGVWTNHAPFTLMSALSPFSYIFLHGNWTHAMVNTAMIMAFGTGVERWIGGKRMLIFFILCGLASVLVHFLLDPFSENPVIGASGGISGLFAAVLVMMQRIGHGETGRYGMWPFIILWVIVSVLFGFTGGPGGSSIAWAAHIGGFLAGFLLLKPVLKMKP